MPSKVYIVLVNYNSSADTIECLQSILKSTVTGFQIVIVDNSLSEEYLEAIYQWGIQHTALSGSVIKLDEGKIAAGLTEKIILVKALRNNGFAAANNIGAGIALKSSDTGFIWFLNNDTTVETDTLHFLLSHMTEKENSRVGMSGAKVMQYGVPGMIQSAGGGTMNKVFMYPRLTGAGETDRKQYDKSSLHLDFIAGCSMFTRIEAVREAGGLSENYFLYCEELDWATKAAKKGWGLGYCFQAVVHHKGGSSTGGKGYLPEEKTSTSFSDYYFQRSKILYLKKFYWYWLPTLYSTFVIVILNRIRRRQFDRIKPLLNCMLHPERMYPGNRK